MIKIKYAFLFIIINFSNLANVNAASASSLEDITKAFNECDMRSVSTVTRLIHEQIDTAVTHVRANPDSEVCIEELAGLLTTRALEFMKERGSNEVTRMMFTRAAELGDPVAQMELAINLNRRSLPLGAAYWIVESLTWGKKINEAEYAPYLMKKIRSFATAGFIADVKAFLAGSLEPDTSEEDLVARSNVAAAGAGGAGSSVVPSPLSTEDVKRKVKKALIRSFLKYEGYMDRGFTYNPTLEAVRWGDDGKSYDFNDSVFAYCTDLYLERDDTVFNGTEYALAPADLDNLVNSKAFKRLYGINLNGTGITDAQVVILADKKAFAGVTNISLKGNRLKDVAAKALAESRVLGSRIYGLGLPRSGRYEGPAIEMSYSLEENAFTIAGIEYFLTAKPLPLRVEIYHPAIPEPTSVVDAVRIIRELYIGEQNPVFKPEELRALREKVDSGDIRYHVRNFTYDGPLVS